MTSRRTFLAVAAGITTAVSGCTGQEADEGDDGDGSSQATETPSGENETDESGTRYLRGAPVEVADDPDPVLSTDEAFADFDPIHELAEAVFDTFEVTSVEISAAEAEEFQAITADVERNNIGNPPGYYIGHDGRTLSVALK